MEHLLVDLPTERAVLAGIITYGSNGYNEVADIVHVNVFTDEFNKVIFQCCEYILKDSVHTQIDLASILTAASSLGYSDILARPDERKLLRSIMNFPIYQNNIRRMAGKLTKLETARRLKKQIQNASKDIDGITGDESIDHIISLAEDPIFQFTATLHGIETSGPIKLGDDIQAYVDYLVANPCKLVGISTGYPIYDMSIGGGLRKGTISLIGARPKIGKTTFADNVGIHVSNVLNIPVLNIDTEMSKEDHRVRILANLAKVPIEEIETGQFAQNSWKYEKIKRAIDKFKKMPYYYESTAGKSFNEIISIIRRWLHSVPGINNPCLIIYDYFKLTNAEGLTRNIQEYQILGFQMSALHDFLSKYMIPCLCFIQLNKDGINRETTGIISGSDRQSWLCDNFSIFKKKSDEEIAEEGSTNRKIVTLMTRQGAGLDDGDYINMKFNGQYNEITEHKTRNQVRNEKIKLSTGFVINDTKPVPFN